jgi:NADH:ubiquinone oxidoreductase subunit E
MLTTVFERFVKESPISVMARALIERVFQPTMLDEWFAEVADAQYTRTLLFSTVFDLMSLVVCGIHPSVHAAYQAAKKTQAIEVSIQAVYDKLNGLEVTTSAALVRQAAEAVTPLIETLGGMHPPRFPGYRVKILDGNCIEATEHRLAVLRSLAAGALPGKSMVVYDPRLGIPTDVFPCEDGHAQERALLGEVLATVQTGDVWVADRNMCTNAFTCGIDDRQAYFVIRQHGKFSWESAGPEVYAGHTDTGRVYEQPITVTDASGRLHPFRRIRVCLKQVTRDGDCEIAIISNLPHDVATATALADCYRGRWTIETAFQEVTEHLHSEINTLGYPPAALFGFCVALVAYMLFQVIQAALKQAHGRETVEQEVSEYYLVEEVSSTYRGMMIALPDEEWVEFGTMNTTAFVAELTRIAAHATLAAYQKHRRGPKKPPAKKVFDVKRPHVSTARLLRAATP